MTKENIKRMKEGDIVSGNSGRKWKVGEEIKNYKEKNEIILKDFHAEWCQPCKIQDTIIEALKEIYKSKVKFENIDIDKKPEIADRFKIKAVPTLIIQKNGIVVNRFVGVTSKKILENELNNLLRNVY